MSADSTPVRPPRSTVIAVIAATTAAQVASVMGVTVFPVIAPELAVNLGVEPSLVGYQISLIYGVAMAASPFMSNMVARWGACRTIQAGLGLGALAMLLAMSSNLAALAVVSALLGLGMAAMPPASAHLLFRFTPHRHRNLIFSLKQSGIPLAWVLMAAAAPAITLGFGWQWALALVLGTALAAAVTMQRWREDWDCDRGTAAAQSRSLAAGLALVWRYPPLRWLAVMSFFYTFVQLCLATFAVTLLVQEARYSLVGAGLLFSLTNALGVAARILAGRLADFIADSARVLAVLGTVMMMCCIALGFVSPAWPGWALTTLILLFGASAIAWNGVFLAEVARRTPAGQVSIATGGAMAWTYGGVLAGPALFATAYKLVGSYTTTFGLLAVVTAAGVVALRAGAIAARPRPLQRGARREKARSNRR